MDEFDKEFENAPDAEFDQAFEQAPATEETNILDKPSPLGPTLRESGETAMDFATGAAKGATLGAADEIGGVLSTGLEKLAGLIPGTDAYEAAQIDEQLKAQGFTVPEESLMETYRGYQQASEQAQEAASERSPIASTLGELGGNIATGVAAGGALGIGKTAADAQKAKPLLDIMSQEGKLKAGLELLKRGGTTAAQAAPIMALESVAGSKNQLVGPDAQPMEVGKDVLDNLLFGGTALLGMQGVSDIAAPAAKKAADVATEAMTDTAFGKKMKTAFDWGQDIGNPLSATNQPKLERELLTTNPEDLMSRIKTAKGKLGKDVGDSLAKAEKAGQIINVSDSLTDTLNSLNYTYKNLIDIQENPKARQIFQKIQQGATDLTPTEAKFLLDDVNSAISRFGNMKTPGPLIENKVIPGLQKFTKTLSEQLKTEIPEYGISAKRFAEFTNLVPEQIMSGDVPVGVTDIFMGDMRNADPKLYKGIKNLATTSTAEGTSSESSRQAATLLKENLDKLKASQPDLPFESDKFMKDIGEFSDKTQTLREMQTVKAPVKTLKTSGVLAGLGELGGGGTLVASNVAGRVSVPVAKLSKKVYNMPAEKLTQYAQAMENIPGLQMYGKALRQGLENGDTAKKNAALFSIMQNPSARIIFNDNQEED